MGAAKYDFNIEQGSSFTLSLVYKDSTGTPVDLTGWCARLTWKSNIGVDIFTTEITNANYRFEIDELNGKLILQFPASVTNGFEFTSAKYDLELQAPDDFYIGGGKYTTRLIYGTVTIIKRFSQTNDVLGCAV